MNPVSIFKTVAALAVSSGAGAIVGNAIKLTAPTDPKLLQKVTFAVGGLALSSLVAQAASKHVEHEIDDTVEQLKVLKQLISEHLKKDAATQP